MILETEGSFEVARRKRNYSPSPVLWPLAEYYINSDAYGYWGGDPLEFRHLIKDYMIKHLSQSIEVFVEDLPFLKVSLPVRLDEGKHCELNFDDSLKGFLKSRKIAKVTVWNTKGLKGSLTPLTSEQIRRRTGQEVNEGGFEINLGYTFIQSVLTTLSHEIGHTYFYDIHKNPPECLVSDSILEKKKWYRQFEGMAFDLGREILLPRESFTRYVVGKYNHPSLANFFSLYSKLRVSKDVLAQRLMKDLNLWRACLFWGRVDYVDKEVYGKRMPGAPHIIVRNRDKRKGGFASFSIKKELSDDNSSLRKAILNQVEDGIIEGFEVYLDTKKYKLDLKSQKLSEKEKWFIAMLYP